MSGREAVYSEDGDTLVMTYHEFIQRDSANPDGKGIIIAVFDRNSTGACTIQRHANGRYTMTNL